MSFSHDRRGDQSFTRIGKKGFFAMYVDLSLAPQRNLKLF
jgi:hypothetical protein